MKTNVNPPPEIVRALIDKVKLGDVQSLDELRSFVETTVRLSGRKTAVRLAESILTGIESGELKLIHATD